MTAGDLVVVGVDGSEAGRRALRWALRAAARRGSAVEVVTAWASPPRGSEPTAPWAPEDEAAARRMQADIVNAELAALDTPAPAVAQEVVQAHPVQALTHAAAARAAFLVVGSHGQGRLRSALLGSVSEGCIRHASCPVVVVPAPHPDEERPGELATSEASPT